MISSKKIELLKIWKNNLFSVFSISEIMKKTNKKTKTWIFNSLNELSKKKLIQIQQKGNINLYSLNLKNPILENTLQYIDLQDINPQLLQIMEEIIENVPIKTYCLLVFGSYAENKQTKDSDMDICFLIENEKTKKIIEPFIKEIKLNYTIEIDEQYITFDEFVEMLLNNEENLGKQIFKNNKLFFNPNIYFQLLKEAYKHGFR